MHSEEQLKEKKMRELVEIYNSLEGTKPVKRFGSKPDVIARIIKFQEYKSKKNKKIKGDKISKFASLLREHRKLTNIEFSELKFFKKLCNQADTPATRRQAAKFRNSRGKVFLAS